MHHKTGIHFVATTHRSKGAGRACRSDPIAPLCLHPMPPNLLSCNLTSLLFLLPLNLVLPRRRPLLICLPFCQTPYICLASLSPFLFHCSPPCLPASFLSLSPTFQPYLPFRLPPSILPTSSSPTSPFFFFFPTTPPPLPHPTLPCLLFTTIQPYLPPSCFALI